MKSLTKYVVFSIGVLLAYTPVCMYVQAKYQVDLSTLTTCIFAFFGGEVTVCALMKIFKMKYKEDSDELAG